MKWIYSNQQITKNGFLVYKRQKICYFIPMTASEFWEKIKKILNERKQTFVWLCEQAGVDVQIMKNRIYKERIPDVENTLKLLAVLGITFEEFFGVEDLFPVKNEKGPKDGDGLLEGDISIPEELKTKKFKGHLFSTTIGGDSMAPTLSDGDTVIFDDFGYLADGIYAVSFEERCYVKRLQQVSGGIKLISDNRNYEAVLVNADSDKLKIIGKVHYVLHKV